MITLTLWKTLVWEPPTHTLLRYFTPYALQRKHAVNHLLRLTLALLGVWALAVFAQDFAQRYAFHRLELLAFFIAMPGALLLTLLGVTTFFFIPMYLFIGTIAAGQQIGVLQRGYRNALRDELTTIIPGGHRLLITNLGAALYQHPQNFFGIGFPTAAELHFLSNIGLVGIYIFLLELRLNEAYMPHGIPAEITLHLHPQIMLLGILVLVILYMDIRQQLILGFVAGVAAIYAIPYRLLASIIARLLVAFAAFAGYMLMWTTMTKYPAMYLLDTDNYRLLWFCLELVLIYGLVFFARDAMIWALWRGIRVWGHFT